MTCPNCEELKAFAAAQSERVQIVSKEREAAEARVRELETHLGMEEANVRFAERAAADRIRALEADCAAMRSAIEHAMERWVILRTDEEVMRALSPDAGRALLERLAACEDNHTLARGFIAGMRDALRDGQDPQALAERIDSFLALADAARSSSGGTHKPDAGEE